MYWISFDFASAYLFLVGFCIIFLCRLYNIVHPRHLLRHLLYWLLHRFEILLVDLFHLVEQLLMLLLHHGKHHCRVVFCLLFICGFFFDVVNMVEFGSLAWRGA